MKFNDFSSQVIGCAIEVHKELGPGLLESAYQECLFHELKVNGLNVRKEVPTPLKYKGIKLECGYRLDLLVEESLIIEIKSVDSLNEVHLAQILTYLKLKDLKSGLLINFNVTKLANGIRRVVNNY